MPGPLFPIETLTPYVDSLSERVQHAAPAKSRLINYPQEQVEQALLRFSHKVHNASGVVTVMGGGIGNLTQESYLVAGMNDESTDNFAILGLNEDAMQEGGQENCNFTGGDMTSDEESSNDFGSLLDVDNKGVHDDEQHGSAHSQRLQAFLQNKAPDTESFQPRLALKAEIDELYSVIEGCRRPHEAIKEARTVITDFVASVRANCQEKNKNGKLPSAIVSYNQERERKKSRQFVANHGIR